MSTIRRQSIISSGIVYFGFALGALNTLLLTREKGAFAASQYGLFSIFMAVGSIMYSFSSVGMTNYIYKFYPYYKDNLPTRKNDMMTWAFVTSFVGFLLVMGAGIVFKGLIIRKFGRESPDLVKYYYLLFPFGYGLTIYTLLEAYAWQLKRAVLTNFLREVQSRLYMTVLILLSYCGLLTNFDVFMKLYACTYILLAVVLVVILVRAKELHFTFSVSRVTRKFFRRIRAMVMLVWSGTAIFTVSFYFAQIVIAAVVPGGLAYVAVYTLAQYIGSIIQVPQRAIISASIGPLARAWKDKDLGRIARIYQRSSINQLIFSVGMFVLIWINFRDGVLTFHLKPLYLEAQAVFFFIGLTRIVDLGTGVNTQIIATSTFWRFDLISGIILLLITLPLNYYLARKMGSTGPAVADLVSFTLYNAIRCLFLYRKFRMQPFTPQTLYTLALGCGTYYVCHLLFDQQQGFIWLCIRSLVFLTLFIGGTLLLKLSPDAGAVVNAVKKRLKVGT